ncbi:winged helix-turn-helix transcriptional regulator [Saccharomonospora piscinae]|uniref:GntR family transcriptional regulator n=1 Tax=Saccharomonospora piscinae TaxID=687388 RepID=UPI001106211A|nr:winged helix-turn-helix domain-containing protein [Saccharomonospora piscinae]TLW92092.1 winged helix-turn-helix transcriptional regulator [Saccharomonospora piscinae]
MSSAMTGMAAYQRVAEAIRQDIRTGRLKARDKLPSNRGVADLYDVSLGTAQKALKALEDEGWVLATPSVGVFVSDSMPEEHDRHSDVNDVRGELAKLRAAIETLTARVDSLEARSDQS